MSGSLFFLKLNEMRFTKRRKPDPFTSVCQPFNPEKFNFTKVPSKEVSSEEQLPVEINLLAETQYLQYIGSGQVNPHFRDLGGEGGGGGVGIKLHKSPPPATCNYSSFEETLLVSFLFIA